MSGYLNLSAARMNPRLDLGGVRGVRTTTRPDRSFVGDDQSRSRQVPEVPKLHMIQGHLRGITLSSTPCTLRAQSGAPRMSRYGPWQVDWFRRGVGWRDLGEGWHGARSRCKRCERQYR